MEREKHPIRRLFLILLLCLTPAAQAQTAYGPAIYRAYISGDTNQWKEVVQKMEAEPSPSVERRLELVNYYYGYIGYLIGSGDNKAARSYIRKGDKLLDAILQDSPGNARAYAYKGSFLGFSMALNKLKTMTLGPQSMQYINRAYDTDPRDAQVVIDKANMLYYAPALFGGDKDEAIRLYRQAVGMMESSGQAQQNWAYLNLLVMLARTYEKEKQYDQAMELYRKALQKEPAFKWVRDELYPRLAQKVN